MPQHAILAPYLPQDRLAALMAGEALPDPARGSALFADISGFTPLTESLRSEFGARRGAEELGKRLDAVYAALIERAEVHGGSIIGFAGDAITCWFAGEGDGADAARRAVTCALDFQLVMKGFADVAVADSVQADLGIKVSIASGDARRLVVGDPAIQLLDEIAGSTVARMAAGEHLAERGEVLADDATIALCGTDRIAETRSDPETGERFSVLSLRAQDGKTIGGLVPVVGMPRGADLAGVPTADALRPWIPASVFKREMAGQGDFIAELRPCVVIFVNFEGIDYDGTDAATRLDQFTRHMQEIVSRLGGELLQITIGDKGSYAYLAFGAVSAHEDDGRRAVTAALEIREAAGDLEYLQPPRIGISKGTLFVGTYGGATRRTFSALGDEVNIAARLMQSAASGEVLVTGRVRYAIERYFEFNESAFLSVKGKKEAIQAYSIAGALRNRSLRLPEPSYTLPVAGRRRELEIMASKLDLALAGQRQVIAVVGEAGLGKSRLIAEGIRLARRKAFACYGGACQSDGRQTSYLPWRSVWNAFFDIDPAAPLRRQVRSLETTLNDYAPGRDEALPLLSSVLGIALPENEMTQSLDAEGRKTALHALLVDCLSNAEKEEPIFIVLEDLHWVDILSLELLLDLTRSTMPGRLIFALAFRPPEMDSPLSRMLQGIHSMTRIDLGELPRDALAEVASAKWAQLFPARHTPLPEAFLTLLLQRAQGNPFFIEEMLNYMRDRGVDFSNEKTLAAIDLPESIQTLILARIDQLTDGEKITLKVASVIGRLFRALWLPGYYPEVGDLDRVKRDLAIMERLEITPLDSPEPDLAFLFKHIMTQEVAYESLPYEMRERLHEKLALYLEASFADAPPLDTIAFHFGRSANKEKQKEYFRKAGDAASKAYANAAAIDYYGRLLPLLSDPVQKAELLLDRAECFDWMGRMDEAESDYRTALSYATQCGSPAFAARAEHGIGVMRGLRGDSAGAAEFLDRASREFDALGDRASRASVLKDSGLFLARKGDFVGSAVKFEAALTIARAVGDRKTMAMALNYLGSNAHARGEYAEAKRLFGESLAIKKELGERLKIANTLNNLGVVAQDQGEYAEAVAYYMESLELRKTMGHKSGIAECLANLGTVEQASGHLAAAREKSEESVALYRELGEKSILAIVLSNLGGIANAQNDLPAARQFLTESLGIQREVADAMGTVWSLVLMAKYLSDTAQLRRAALIAAAAEKLRASIGLVLEPLTRTAYETALAACRAGLSSADYDAAQAEGKSMTAEMAISAALGDPERNP